MLSVVKADIGEPKMFHKLEQFIDLSYFLVLMLHPDAAQDLYSGA
jgi:hypothetical protein